MRRILAFLPVLSVLAAVPAAAQGMNSGGVAGSGFSPPVHGVGPKFTRPDQAPPGLPGTQPRDTAAPAQIPLDVPPTEALFDAINRGDIASARDALNRGADLNGRNVLGMTPIDLSIDLARNDITFLLMSMRGEAAVSGPPAGAAVAETATPKPKAARKQEVAKLVSKRPKMAPPQDATASAAPSVTYASVPATPVPQAGFLGFGASATP